MKDIKNPKYLYIISLIIIILVSYLLLKENFVEKKCIQKALGTETEYLYPILKNISSSIELSYLCNNPYIITSMGSIKDSTRPYIFFHAEPGVTNSNDYNTALKDKKCVACFITSTVPLINKKTYYLPFLLCRGEHIFNSTPFERKFVNNERKKLAAYIAQHSPKHREEFFNLLRLKDSTVESLGKSLNTNKVTLPGNWKDLPNIYKDYTFGFAMENSYEDGYITEKIMNVFLGGAIPLYWGSPKVKEIFNTKAFIYINDFPSFEDCINYIIEISKNRNVIRQMQNEPIFNYSSPLELWKYYDTPSPQWVVNISNEISKRIHDF